MQRECLRLLGLAVLSIAIGGCASSFDAIDRSANAFARKLEDEERCYSRPGPNGQITAGCSFWSSTSETTTTTDADGRVTKTTTRTVNGEPVPERP